MDLTFDVALFLIVRDMNLKYGDKYGQPYVSVEKEPAFDASYFALDYNPTHRWTFFTLAGHYSEITLDTNRLEFVSEQFTPKPVVVRRRIDLRTSVHQNIVNAMAEMDTVMKARVV